MKEQELLFTDVCTLKHSYVPKSSLRVSSLWCKCFMNRNARWLSAITDERRKHTHTHTHVLYSYARTHTHSIIYVFHSNKRGNHLVSTASTGCGRGEVEGYSSIYLCQIITNTIESIGELLQQRHHYQCDLTVSIKPLNLNEF